MFEYNILLVNYSTPKYTSFKAFQKEGFSMIHFLQGFNSATWANLENLAGEHNLKDNELVGNELSATKQINI